jgi:hypothetical protein
MLTNDLSYWTTTDIVLVGQYQLVRQVLADPTTFSSAASIPSITRGKPTRVQAALRGLPPEPPMVINAVADDHIRQRTIFDQAFTAAKIRARTPLIEAAAANYANALRPAGSADLVGAYIRKVLDEVINDFYGYPAEDRNRVHRYCDAVNDLLQPAIDNPTQTDTQVLAARTLHDAAVHLEAMFHARAADRPEREQDLLYHLVHGHGAYQLTPPERFWNAVVSRIAAEETTRYLIASAIAVMLELGLWEQARRLGEQQRHQLIRRCVEETLRAHSPHTGLMRITTLPTRLGSHDVPVGTLIAFNLAAANRDPDVFTNPHQFDPARRTRNGMGHLAFGHGSRKCPGRYLARLEALIAIDTLLVQLPDLRRLNPAVPPPQVPHLLFAGPERLDATWTT